MMFFKKNQNIVQTMHLTMYIAHPYHKLPIHKLHLNVLVIGKPAFLLQHSIQLHKQDGDEVSKAMMPKSL